MIDERHFSALRRLNFKTKSFRSVAYIHPKLATISKILMSATSPIGISSITIELRVDLGDMGMGPNGEES